MYSLCCISNELKEQGHSFQTMTAKRYHELAKLNGSDSAINAVGERWLHNMKILNLTMRHCNKNGWNYRVPSSIFPLYTYPDKIFDITSISQHEEIFKEFEEIKNNKGQIRLSMHPDQFVVLASKNINAVQNSFKDLYMHGNVLDWLGCERNYNSPINIHINCSDKNLEETFDRFAYWFELLPESVKSRLVIENEDKGVWNVDNLLKYFWGRLHIPITWDNLHHKCNPCSLDEEEAMEACAETWGRYKPLFHYCEADQNNKNPRAHASEPSDIPPSDNYDWEIELKNKDRAIRYLYLIKLVRESEELNLYK